MRKLYATILCAFATTSTVALSKTVSYHSTSLFECAVFAEAFNDHEQAARFRDLGIKLHVDGNDSYDGLSPEFVAGETAGLARALAMEKIRNDGRDQTIAGKKLFSDGGCESKMQFVLDRIN